MICDGASLDEVRFHVHGLVERVGYAVVPVEGDPTWAYTIGLSERFDQPELIVVGYPPGPAAALIDSLVEHMREGQLLEPGPWLRCADHGGSVLLLEVHPSHFENGTFNLWLDYYGALGPPYPEVRALQVVPFGRDPIVRLDGTGRTLTGADRATRRAAARAAERARRRRRRGPRAGGSP